MKQQLHPNLRAWRKWASRKSFPSIRTVLPAGVNSLLQIVQERIFVDQSVNSLSDPIFIIGHWRSGTTLLHELLSLDSAATSPNTYECLYPSHFLLTEGQMLESGQQYTKIKRPMDDVMISLTSPQEDEFALLALGAPSPYEWMLFPSEFVRFRHLLQMDGWTEREKTEWAVSLRRFLAGVHRLRPGRMTLKSPTHSFRVKVLLGLFPNARFVHIVRNPSHVFASTLRLWERMFEVHSRERPDLHALPLQVLEIGKKLEETLNTDLPLIAPGKYFRMRYEDLVANPEATVASVYEFFGWEGSADVVRAVSEYGSERLDYRARSEEVIDQHKAQLYQEWSHIYQKYGYKIE